MTPLCPSKKYPRKPQLICILTESIQIFGEARWPTRRHDGNDGNAWDDASGDGDADGHDATRDASSTGASCC